MTFTQGQTVHVLKSINGQRFGGALFDEGTVSRVGRKFVYVTCPDSYGREIQFDMRGYQVTNCPGNARRIMDDAHRAQYERDADVHRRFDDLGLSGVHRDLGRKFPAKVIESVLGVLEASTPEEG